MKESRIRLAATTILAILTIVSAQAPTTACNTIPTADMIGAAGIAQSYEADGTDNPFDAGTNTATASTLLGITNRFEAGVNFCNEGGEETKDYNAKLSLFEESDRRPATSLGVQGVGKGNDPAFYLVGAKSFGKVRLHLGAQKQTGSTWGMVGLDFDVAKNVQALFDWQAGVGRGHTAGLSWQATPIMGIQMYYQRNNTAEMRNTDFLGVNVSYSFSVAN